jgi:hypothetical protein
MTNWHIEARELASCNCDYSCPCQFNALPSYGNCDAVVGIEIDRGQFGTVKLDGMRAVAIMSWPGPIHEGHGKAQIIIDERADTAQRDALLRILSGQDSEPGATVFSVFASTLEHVYEPLFKPIDISIDVDARKGSVRVDGFVEIAGAPILNPVTGKEHRARIDLPEGFEYRIAEVGRATTQTQGPIALSITDKHAHFARLNMTQSGVVG